MAVTAARGGTDGDEDRVGFPNRAGKFSRELEPPLPGVRSHEVLEARFVDRQLAATEGRDFLGVLVDAGDLVTEIGQTSPGN